MYQCEEVTLKGNDNKTSNLSDSTMPDFIKNEKIDDALKNVFRQEIQIYNHTRAAKSEQQRQTVLGFPSLMSSRSRFMLHSVISSEFSNTLTTFSIGVEPERLCYVISNEILTPSIASELVNEDGKFSFDSISAVEVAVGCPLETKQILTDPMVINKIQTGCDMAIDQAVNLSHVIELCDFPSTLKTSDLDDVLHQLKLEKYYELIWVDDTHAIAVMSDNEAAQKVLNVQHSVVKLRPFTEASQQSQEKAKMLGLYGVDVYKKRPKTSMVAANRMLNRALGIRGIDRESKTRSSPNQPSKNLQETRQTAVTNPRHSNVPSRKDFLQNQKMGSQQSSIAANRMFNRALGIKSDTRLKPKPPRTFSQQQQQCTITRNNIICDNDNCDVEEYDVKVNTVEADMSDKQKIDRKVKQTKNCYDPNLAANRMFQRALGSSIPAHQHSPSSTPEGNQNKQ